MNIQKKTISEHDLFKGKDLITVSAEIQKDIYEKIMADYNSEMSEGNTSVTIEQFNGAFLQTGYYYNMYSILRKVFEK